MKCKCDAVNYTLCVCADRLSFVHKMMNRSTKDIQDACEHFNFEDYEDHEYKECDACGYIDDGSKGIREL